MTAETWRPFGKKCTLPSTNDKTCNSHSGWSHSEQMYSLALWKPLYLIWREHISLDNKTKWKSFILHMTSDNWRTGTRKIHVPKFEGALEIAPALCWSDSRREGEQWIAVISSVCPGEIGVTRRQSSFAVNCIAGCLSDSPPQKLKGSWKYG